MPGPGQYGNPVLKENLGGKFNLSNPKSDVDWMVPPRPPTSLNSQLNPRSFLFFQVWRSNQLPAPGQYGNPGEKEGLNHRGGRFSTSKPKTDVDWSIYRAQSIPGPGQYGAPALPKPGGGKFNTGNAKSDIDWMVYRASKMPGPGNYHPENYQLPGHPNAKVGVAFQGLSPRTHNVEEAEQLSVPLPLLASLQSSLQERFYTAMGGKRSVDPAMMKRPPF